ncbi:hypothetical protein [Allosphingosinicella deserti]|uniref:hypothetical protein n=1 Tax=Allosphingosinicella deserti TaxID=2116704 RepID=UPI000D0B573B|nr:hypothetical protein [Sphingomonas deserti]
MTRPFPPQRRHRGAMAIFAAPLLIALVTVAGLIVALTGDGWRDHVAWVALSLPLSAFAWAFSRRH